VIVFSILSPIEDVLAEVLKWIHGTAGVPWAWAIVILTVMVRMLLVPLTVRQIHSMQNLQAHAPEMKAIQQRNKGDRQKMNEELMAFYKENQINPAASCLPMLAQMPVFFALYFVLRDFEKEILPHYPAADLGWLHVVPDITAGAITHWSGYVLLVIYAASQTASTIFMSATMDKTQRMILLIMPLVFLAVIANFPAGLVLYWMTTNLWTVGQGLITRRLVPKKKGGVQPKRSSRTPPRAETEAPAEREAATAPRAATPGAPVRKVKRKKKGGSRR
jgi:YidC/Oxa1 family membrane protein insertase